jgi:hypothetical protein
MVQQAQESIDKCLFHPYTASSEESGKLVRDSARAAPGGENCTAGGLLRPFGVPLWADRPAEEAMGRERGDVQ